VLGDGSLLKKIPQDSFHDLRPCRPVQVRELIQLVKDLTADPNGHRFLAHRPSPRMESTITGRKFQKG
jgi:hypothetical protein